MDWKGFKISYKVKSPQDSVRIRRPANPVFKNREKQRFYDFFPDLKKSGDLEENSKRLERKSHTCKIAL